MTKIVNPDKDTKSTFQQTLFSDPEISHPDYCDDPNDTFYLSTIIPKEEKLNIYESIRKILAAEFYWDSADQLDETTKRIFDDCLDQIYQK